MLTPVVQRWRDRRGSYRPAGEPVDTRLLEVAPAEEESAKAFVLRHHYSATYPAARERYGLYWRGVFAGVAVFSQPVNNATLGCLPGEAAGNVELGRLVLLDDVPANAESYFIARCFELLRKEGYTGVVSFSDPVPRHTLTNTVVHPGHVGTIYQATNGVYLGRGKARTLRLLPNGTVYSPRAEQKVRALERGWRYAAQQLVEAGVVCGVAVPPLVEGEDSRDWLRRYLPLVTRPLPHPGNHKYAWVLHRRDRRHLPPTKPYPKLVLEPHQLPLDS